MIQTAAKQVERGGQRTMALNGAQFVAYAMKQINPEVVAAYPITPQTIITETFSDYVANGEVDTEFVAVESEHAALSTCIGAAAAGVRTQTATSGPGLALMWEVLWVASGSRFPIVLHLCTRALSAPINILGDQSDLMGVRDTGWVLLVAESPQEAYDNAIQAVRIAEHPDVLLPIMAAQDGFILTHCLERGLVLPDEAVRAFVGDYTPDHSALDTEHPVTFGSLDHDDFYFEHKRQQAEAMTKALAVIDNVGREYGALSGRAYSVLEPYLVSDADLVVVAMGAVCTTIRSVVDELRSLGVKAGLLKVRSFRPFPALRVGLELGQAKAVAVVDRALSFGGASTPLFAEVTASLAGRRMLPPMLDYVAGLGGRDMRPDHFRRVFRDLQEAAAGRWQGYALGYLGLRESP